MRIGYHRFSVTSMVMNPQVKMCFVNKQLTYYLCCYYRATSPAASKHYIGCPEPLMKYFRWGWRFRGYLFPQPGVTYINAIAVSTTYQSRLTLFSKQLFRIFFIPVNLCVPTFLASEMLTLVTKWPSLDTLSWLETCSNAWNAFFSSLSYIVKL